MPISKENKKLYPDNWGEIRREILKRDGNRCKLCKTPNYSIHPITKSKVILTIVHLDHNPENNGVPGMRPNLAALCQRCHNRWDSDHRTINRIKTRLNKIHEAGQGELL